MCLRVCVNINCTCESRSFKCVKIKIFKLNVTSLPNSVSWTPLPQVEGTSFLRATFIAFGNSAITLISCPYYYLCTATQRCAFYLGTWIVNDSNETWVLVIFPLTPYLPFPTPKAHYMSVFHQSIFSVVLKVQSLYMEVFYFLYLFISLESTSSTSLLCLTCQIQRHRIRF